MRILVISTRHVLVNIFSHVLEEKQLRMFRVQTRFEVKRRNILLSYLFIRLKI